ncbi:MAG: peptidoglycan DD-metalloendopeptidase family protein [Sulfurospirillum sp.]|nr:peptidoglycan DD-metalloendopeptidase family protein [Sulfurospirillum sp.]
MIRLFFILIFWLVSLSASTLHVEKWGQGETFLTFLENNKLPLSIYYNLDNLEQELATEIMSNVKYQILKSDDGTIEQVLIPIGEELQLHIIKRADKYEFTTTPISYQEQKLSVTIDIENSPYQDIINETNNYLLAHEFIQAFKNSVNFKRLQKGDRVVIFYTKKTRLGRQFGSPKIEVAMIEERGRKNYVFSYNSGRFYDIKGKEIAGFFLAKPVNYHRISDGFTYKRWHPILKKYRAHLGIDYAAKTGTSIRAASHGKIIQLGNKGGYGKCITIKHSNGYKTLYAHMNGYKKGMRVGRKVKKGQTIGYVGSTGLSTGPHLHFGLYKNNRAINPNSVIRVTKSKLKGKTKEEFFTYSKKLQKDIQVALVNYENPTKEKSFDYIVSLDEEFIN